MTFAIQNEQRIVNKNMYIFYTTDKCKFLLGLYFEIPIPNFMRYKNVDVLFGIVVLL